MFNLDESKPIEWQEPEPLFSDDIKPETYPIDVLPDGFKQAVMDVQAITQAPLAMVGTCALGALSLASQGLYDVARNNQLSSPISIYSLVVAESGERKTSVDGHFTKPLREFEASQAEFMKPVMAKYRSAYQTWEAQKQGVLVAIKDAGRRGKETVELQKKMDAIELEQPKKPKVPNLIYGDATSEALTYGLAKEWPSAGVVSSEAGAIFGSHSMTGDAVTRNLAALNQLWEAGIFKINRRTSESYMVSGARLTVGLQVQLPVLVGFMAKQSELARGSGFLARFLMCEPESTQGTRNYQEPNKSLTGLNAFHTRLTQLLTQPLAFDESGEGIETTMLKLSPQAKPVWIEAYNEIENELKPQGDLENIRDVASKAADNIARVSALFHVYRGDESLFIGLDDMKAAISLVFWHLDESNRLLKKLSYNPSINMAAKLDAWLINECNKNGCKKISTRQAQQYSPLRTKDGLRQAVDELIELERVAVTSDGRQKWIVVNPKLLNGV